jgi:hypothetical protein
MIAICPTSAISSPLDVDICELAAAGEAGWCQEHTLGPKAAQFRLTVAARDIPIFLVVRVGGVGA